AVLLDHRGSSAGRARAGPRRAGRDARRRGAAGAAVPHRHRPHGRDVDLRTLRGDRRQADRLRADLRLARPAVRAPGGRDAGRRARRARGSAPVISEPILPPPEFYPGRHRDAGPLTPDSLRGRDLLVMYEAWRSVFDLPGLLRAAGVTAAATHTRWLPGYREPDLHRFWRESRGKPFSELTWGGMPLRSAVVGSAACWY